MKKILLGILLLTLAGCVRAPQVAPPVERRKEDLLQGINRSYERLMSMRGRGRIAVSTGKETYSGNFSLIYKNPGRLRIDVYGPFGVHLLSISSVDDRVLVFLPTANIALASDAARPGVAGLGEVVTGYELRELTTATVHLPEKLAPEEVILNMKNSLAALIFEKSGHTNMILINPKTDAMLERGIYDETDSPFLRCEYRRFKLLRGTLRPHVVKIQEEKTGNRLEMIFEHQSLNVKVADSDFDLKMPEGTEIIQN